MRTAIWLIGVYFGLAISCPAQGFNTYHMGNSLTWDARVSQGLPSLSADAGFEHDTGHHIRCGKPLDYMANNPEDVCISSNQFGLYSDALVNSEWDAVTLQPHTGSTPQLELAAIQAIVAIAHQNPANTDTRFYLYATWPDQPMSGQVFGDIWFDTALATSTDPFARVQSNFQWILDELRSEPSVADTTFFYIPGGEVLAELDDRMRDGQIPGFTDVSMLYRDSIHLSNVGRFVAANTFFATLFGQDPTGLPVNNRFTPSPNWDNQFPITATLAATIQQVVWEVVRNHPDTLIPLLGDADNDRLVTGADLVSIQQNFSTAGLANGVLIGDANDDGFVTGTDIISVQQNFASVATVQLAPVPEPTSVTMLSVAFGILLRTQGRPRRHP